MSDSDKISELERQLLVMTGKYEIARGIADKALKKMILMCTLIDCKTCPFHNDCDFTQYQSQLSELDK